MNSSQPFSGNRQWGWNINQNGNLEIYTRAVAFGRQANRSSKTV